MANITTIGYFGSGCIPQLPKDGSVIKDAYIEFTPEEALEYWWKSKTYTINSFNINVNIEYSGYVHGPSSYVAEAELVSISPDALVSENQPSVCGAGYGDFFQFNFGGVTIFDLPLIETQESTAPSGSVLTIQKTLQANGTTDYFAYISNMSFGLELNKQFSYCDYEVTPNLYYLAPGIGFQLYCTADDGPTGIAVTFNLIGGMPDTQSEWDQGGTFTINLLSGASKPCNLYYKKQIPSYGSITSYVNIDISTTITSKFS